MGGVMRLYEQRGTRLHHCQTNSPSPTAAHPSAGGRIASAPRWVRGPSEMRETALICLLAASFMPLAYGGCCQFSVDDDTAITWSLEKCQRDKYAKNKRAELDPEATQPWKDNDDGEICRSFPGCCKLGPPGTCNWRRDCCNQGSSSLHVVDDESGKPISTVGGYWRDAARFDPETNKCETYQWTASTWSVCPHCGTANITRTVACVKSPSSGRGSQPASMQLCELLAGQKPAEMRSCIGTERCGYGFVSGQWLPCSNSCGSGVERREVECVRSDGVRVPSEVCRSRGSEDMETERPCFSSAGCSYFYETSEWNACDDCKQSRTATCMRSDKTRAADALCSLLPKPPLSRECC